MRNLVLNMVKENVLTTRIRVLSVETKKNIFLERNNISLLLFIKFYFKDLINY